MPFRLLKLPILAMDHVLKHLEDCDLIDFSLCSKRCFRIIGRLPKMPTEMKVSICSWRKSIDLYRKGEDFVDRFSWNFAFVEMRRKRKPNREINGVKMFCVKQPCRLYGDRFEVGFDKQTSRRDEEMGAVVAYLLDLFKKCKLVEVDIEFGRFTNEFHAERVFTSERPIENLTCRRESENSGRDILSILKNTKITKSIYSEVRNIEPECLLYMNTPQVTLWWPKFTSNDLMEFLKKWKNTKDLEDINTVFVYCDEMFAPFDYEQLEAKPWDPKNRARSYRVPEVGFIDCSRGMDIESEQHGLLASILLIGNEFQFVVWRDRFPEYNDN